MRKALITIAVAANLIASMADADAFDGKCTALKDATACTASQWCTWTARPAITTPDGKQFTPTSCMFKPHHRQAWQAQQKTPAK